MTSFGIGAVLACLCLAALAAAAWLLEPGLLGQGTGGASLHLAAAGFAIAAILDQTR